MLNTFMVVTKIILLNSFFPNVGFLCTLCAFAVFSNWTQWEHPVSSYVNRALEALWKTPIQPSIIQRIWELKSTVKIQRELFINAGRALFDLITDLDKIELKLPCHLPSRPLTEKT